MAADVTDLGLLSPRLMIPMQKCGRYGTNLAWFEIEAVQPRGEHTNFFHFRTTNEFLVLSDFITASVPDGMTHLFIRERCGDGSVSAYTEAMVKLERDPPSKPRLGKPVQIIANTTEQRVEDILRVKQEVAAQIVPPMPPMPPGYVSPVPLRVQPQPLPGGTNTGYSEQRQRR